MQKAMKAKSKVSEKQFTADSVLVILPVLELGCYKTLQRRVLKPVFSDVGTVPGWAGVRTARNGSLLNCWAIRIVSLEPDSLT